MLWSGFGKGFECTRTRFGNGDIGKYVVIKVSWTVIPIRAEYPTFREPFLLRRLKSIDTIDLPGNLHCVYQNFRSVIFKNKSLFANFSVSPCIFQFNN